MPLLISDSSVLIDLIDGGLIDQLFRLPDEFATPVALFIEELEDDYPNLPAMGLQLVEYEGDDWIEGIQTFKARYRGPSDMDLLALLVARQIQCPLVTGDKKLRAAAEKEQVPVRGTLSLVEAMVVELLISIDEAEAAYERMRLAGSRLPWNETKLQIDRLRKTQT
jgi:predicted nucleic acid-binding protein